MAARKTITLCSKLHKYLQGGVLHSNLNKAELSNLSALASEIGFAVDPEECVEDQKESSMGSW